MLNIFPGGKIILTTPDWIDNQIYERIQEMFRAWMSGDGKFPLVIGSCRVMISQVPAEEAMVVRA